MTASEAGWPLLDRWDLVDRIAKAERGCVLVGPAGAGKSTAARVATGDPVVIAGVAGLAGIPLGALSMAEMTAPFSAPASEGATGAGEHGQGDAPTTGDGDDDLITHLRAWLAHLRSSHRSVVIDDPIDLDPDTALLLVDELRWGLRAVITQRPTQPLPPAMQDVVDELGLDTIAVEPLDSSMVELALETALGREPTEATVDQLTALSGGNPMLLREIVRDLQARDAWVVVGDRVELKADANPSDRLVELLRARFPEDAGARSVLELVAYAGSLPEDLASAVAPPGAVAELVAGGWLVAGETVAIAHPLMAQYVTDQLTTSGIDGLLRGALDQVGAVGQLSSASRLRCLRWSLTAGVDVPVAELRWARGEASRRFDVELAILIADRLSRTDLTLDTTLELALALAQAGRYEEVVRVLCEARDRTAPTATAEVVEIARFLLRFSGPLARLKRWGDPPEGLDSETAAWADGALGTSAFTDLLECFSLLAVGALGDALAQTDVVRAAGIDEVSADADEVRLLCTLYGGDEDEALVAFDRLDGRLADVNHRHPTSVVIDAAASSLLMLAGRFEQAFEFDRRVWSTARAQHDIERAREMSGHLGMTALFLGRVDDSIEAFVRYRNYPAVPNSLRSVYLAGLAQSYALGGHLIDAERALGDADREREYVSPMMLADYEVLTGTVLHLLGHHTEGEARVRRSLAVAMEWQNTRGQLMALHGLCRIGRATPADVEVITALEAVGPFAAPGFSAGVLALVPACVARDGAGIAAVAERFAGTGFALGAAETFTAACRVLSDTSGPGARHVKRARDEWLARCPGLVAATVMFDGGADRLTERELQIAALAAGGITNAVIAARLGISGRTVENSLHRAFSKLGVTVRGELTGALVNHVTLHR
jgi:DNA-binding CsgD family transcriptional regulator